MSWFNSQSKKKQSQSPKLVAGVVARGVGDGTAANTGASWLEGDKQGLHNPLAWDNMPSILQEKFPHLKNMSPLVGPTHQEAEHGYSYYKTSKQKPDYTFPYVVMELDTLNSIAVKFETTPAELARLNKMPSGPKSTIFTGQVLYIPDHDEIAQSAPKTTPPYLQPPTSSEQLHSSVESDGTVQSSSVSQARDCGEQENSREPEESSREPEESSREPEETCTEEQELFEEVTDSHMVLVSRYISDDQGCAHGNLMINQTALMFTPFPDQPLVVEHGAAHFEIMIPLQDVIFAAFTKDVSPPKRKGSLKSALSATEEQIASSSGEGEGVEKAAGEGEGSKVIGEGEGFKAIGEGAESRKTSERGDGQEGGDGQVESYDDGKTMSPLHVNEGEVGDGDNPQGKVGGSDDPQGKVGGSDDPQDKVGGSDDPQDKVGGSDDPQDKVGGSDDNHNGYEEELLATMAEESPHHTTPRRVLSYSPSGDSVSSDHPCFLHIRVSQKCTAAHTYTPLNRTVGIDIPTSPSKGVLQQVKTLFCFAVANQWMSDLVNFISKFHPNEVRRPFCPSSWSEGSYEFISYEDSPNHEQDLSFSDNYFMGAAESSESWEVFSLKDVPKSRIDKMEVEAALPLPVLREVSALMEEHHLKALSNHMVSAAVGHDWSLIYSTFKHGISLRTLYRNMALSSSPESPVLLLVRDDQHKLFGAALTVPLKLSETFYGTGESYLFSFESATDLKIYPWTGVNNYIVKGNTDSICIGCERGHAGLWLDDRLLNGSSEECSTFGNTCLSTTPEFTCTGVEAWGFL